LKGRRIKVPLSSPMASLGSGESGSIRKIVSMAIFGLALAARIWEMVDTGVDRYGDSYHHWLVSYLTAKNGYAYISFKEGMKIVWLPLYHYLNAFLMNLTGIYDLTVPHALNLVFGSLTCVVIYWIVKRLGGGEGLGIFAASALALQPWFMNLNTLALTETLSCFLIVLAIYYYILEKPVHFIVPLILAMLTRYEAWFFAALLLAIAVFARRFGIGRLVPMALCAGAVVSGWCLWSYANTSDPIAWYRMQFTMTGWDIRYFYGAGAFNLSRIKNFFTMALDMTSWLFPIGLVAGLLKRRREIRLVAALELAFLSYLALQALMGGLLPEPKYLIYVFPLNSILLASIPEGIKLDRSIMKKAIIAAFFLSTILLPLRELWVFPVKTYIVKPELEAGLALSGLYKGGHIISDSPTVIYYSKIDPGRFHPSVQIHWYAKGWSRERLKEWYLKNDIRYMVWQNASYSSLWWLYPELSSGRDRIDLTDPKVPIGYFAEYTKTHRFRDRVVAIHIYRIVPY